MSEQDDPKMSEREFVSAMFFEAALPPQEDPQPPTRKTPKKRDEGLRALGRFVKALDTMEPSERRATIGWLADRFLGIRL